MSAGDSLETLFCGLAPDESDADPWKDSAWSWIRQIPTRTRGKKGEELVRVWLDSLGIPHDRSPHTGADLLIAGRPVEVKLSTGWQSSSGAPFTFQQLRDQDWEFAVLVGAAPDRLYLWVATKDALWANSTGQHSGSGAVETRWVSWLPEDAPGWVLNPDGAASSAAKAVFELTGARPGS